MADLEKKLAIFSNIILNEAEEKKEKIISEIEEKKNSAVHEQEMEILTDAYEDIQKAVTKYSKENNERVLKVEMSLKREIIKKRESIIEQIFKEVQLRIGEFINSEEYKDWLINNAKKAVREVGAGEIRINSQDMKYKDDILKELPGCTVVQSADDIIGGVIVCSRNVSADYSFKEMLSEQHQNFLKTSGLSIKA